PTGELDARTGEEIIALFRRLNADGTRIVVVTHDEGLAQAARRVVHMRDGAIVRDERNQEPEEPKEPDGPGEPDRRDSLDRPEGSGKEMVRGGPPDGTGNAAGGSTRRHSGAP